MILLIALVLCILFSGIFSATETAFFSLTPMQVKAYQHSKESRPRLIAALLRRPRKLLVTILMLNVVANLLIQNLTSSIFGNFSTWLLTVGVPLVLVLLFGEIIPKTIAMAKNTAIVKKMAPIIYAIEIIFKPFRDFITYITAPISKIFFFFLSRDPEISREELRHSLRTSKQTGVLTDDEVRLVKGFLNIGEMTVKEVMVPRQEVLQFNINDPIRELIHLFVDEECSRVPVTEGSLETLIGVISSKDFFLHRDSISENYDVKALSEKPSYVPETMQGKALLYQFHETGEEMVFVLDEYGAVSGMVTLEDLVETVVGQIIDRRDEKSLYTRASEDVIICSGKLELTEIEEIFDVRLESPNNMVTIGGYLTELMGDIPKSGAKYQNKHFLFHVLSSDVNRVRRIYIRKIRGGKV